MKLRRLELKDAPYMLEWMHDPGVVCNLQKDFSGMTLEDCRKFIESSWNDSSNKHLAIVDFNDMYMGTVSLKNIESQNYTAEFAICLRSAAMGAGYARFAMEHIFKQAFHEMGLKYVYWYVAKNNTRAVRFYEKNGCSKMESCPAGLVDFCGLGAENYIWYYTVS